MRIACSCSSAHGKGRWSVKNDPETPPTDTSTIQAVTPSDIFSWAGPDVHQRSKRLGLEEKWFAVTGRVVAVKVEADGDLHIALSDATGDKQGTVVCEVPLKPQWCDIRETVFSWTPTRFPFQTSSAKRLKIANPPGRHHCWESVLGHRSRSQRSIKPEKAPTRVRSLGNSSGDETRRSVILSSH
jgi:hypothetical protein